VAGLGMGVAYPTIYLVTMARAGRGTEGSAVALMLLVDSLGAAVGTGLGGSSVAIAHSVQASLRVGLLGAFALALVSAAALFGLAGRLRTSSAA
jgi:fucose permease